MESAKAYDEISIPQIESVSPFIRELKLSRGDKILDMGCGTGNLTKYIADIVGDNGQVVGIDPDAARIEIAKPKYKAISNLYFYVGSSVTQFPHDTGLYYDFHISTAVFHHVPHDEKKIYIQKAHRCLKAGGMLAITCIEKMLDVEKTIHPFGLYPLTQEGYRKLLQDLGLFNNVIVEKNDYTFRSKSFDEFKQWYKASAQQDFDDLDPSDVRENVIIEDDGTVTCKIPRICITARK